MDYYSILGITKSATATEIKSSYKKLAKKYHPDVNKEPDAQEKFKEISRAYQILSDPEKKKAYDQMGHSNFEQARKQGFGGSNQGFGGAYNVNFDDLFGGGFRDPFDIFSELFGGGGFSGRGRNNRQKRGEDIEVVAKLTFEEAVFGAEKELSYKAFDKCTTCKGTGSADDKAEDTTCSQCHGQGQVQQESSFLGARFAQIVTCPQCQGRGKIVKNPCKTCNGTGRERTHLTTKVKTPAGVDNGMQMRIPGKGNIGEFGSNAGDLYVVFKVEDHKYFTRHGSNLYLDVPITIPQAVLGDTIEVPTLEGKKTVKVPKGTNHRQQIKLSNLGVTQVNSRSRGDLILNIDLKLPEKLSAEEQKLYTKLKEVESKPKSILNKLFA